MAYCEWMQMPDGTIAIVRLSGKRPQSRCRCGKPAMLLCDFPMLAGTCDRPLCKSCAVRVGDRDYCPDHPR